jgi:hypothetical protein
MSSLGSPNPFFIAGKKAYEIERSLRFNDDDSTYLNRTPSSVSNRTTFTLSVWIKRASNLDEFQRIFEAGADTSNRTYFTFDGDDKLEINHRDGGSEAVNLTTTARFRDVSAWYHIVLAIDTTQGTSSNRIKIYVNGTQQTAFDTSTYPSSSKELDINSTAVHYFGRSVNDTSKLDGYLAEINFIDGTALTPSSFAETDALTGQWNPKKYTGSYGTNGFYLNFSDNSDTSATTLGKDYSGNGNNFTPNNFSVSAGEGNDSLEDTPTNNFCTLNALDKAAAITTQNGNLQIADSSSGNYNGIRASFGSKTGKYYWEIKFPNTGYITGIGIARADGQISNGNQPTYRIVLGLGSWFTSYNSNNVNTYVNANPSSDYGNWSGASNYSTNDIYMIAVDFDAGKIWWGKNNSWFNNSGTANPATGTDPRHTFTTGNEWFPYSQEGDSSSCNQSYNFGQQGFAYTPPTGFKALNSANLPDPTILLPNKHFGTLLYSSGSSNGTFTFTDSTAVDFFPDWTWLKCRTAGEGHYLFDAVRGNVDITDKFLKTNDTGTETGSGVNGTTVSSVQNGIKIVETSIGSGEIYFTNRNYVTWNWNAGDTDGKTYTVTVVSDSGNKYRFDGFGTSAVTLDLAEGGTYIFNYPSGHPFRFSTTADGTHGGGSEYTTGVTHNSSTQVTIVVAASAPTLYYYCSSHSGMGGQVNTNTTLGSSNFDGSNQTTVKVNATAGFSIVTYTGTGSTTTFGHGLGVAPQVVITKPRSATGNWGVLHTVGDPTAENRLHLNDNGGYSSYQGYKLWNDTVPTSSVFTVREDASTNASSVTYVAYVFSEVAGYSKFGKYTGNASTNGTFSFCGFKPAFVLLKKTNNSDNWTIFDNKRDIDNSMHRRLRANLSDAEATNLSSSADQIDFLSNGFKMRTTSNNHNGNNSSNIFLAFAESPFKNARAR